MANHFDSIADIYNTLWHFSAQYQQAMLDNIIESLQLQEGDRLADLGGGTGAYTRLLKDRVGLAQAYCIEPSANMCQEAAKLPGITAVCADAEAFTAMDLDFDKVLLKEVVHHIQPREPLWQHLRGKLPGRGRLLIVTRPQDTALPLFEQAKEAFRSKQPHHDTLLAELASCGFAATLKIHPYRFSLDKAVWFDMIRHRFMSDLAGFSDAEIGAGLVEIDGKHPGQEIEIPDTIFYISASPR